jgi:hypothetical protein
MCFSKEIYIDDKNNIKPCITDKDIKVYKYTFGTIISEGYMVYDEFLSEVRAYRYCKNKTNPTVKLNYHIYKQYIGACGTLK